MMSFFNLFGTSKKQIEADKQSKIVETIHMISDTLKTQEKRKAHLEKQIESLTTEARDHMRAGKKESAISALKKRKMYEKQVTMIDDSMFNLEVQKLNLENSQFQKSAVDSFAKVNSVLKESSVKADDVERIMEDLQEAVDDQQDVAAVLSRPLVQVDVDDELKELEFEETVIVPNLPNVPTYTVKAKVTEKVTVKATEKADDEDIEALKRQLELI